ncbi:MAG: GyrI-like domain-containing protein [Thermoleophilia bacterium]
MFEAHVVENRATTVAYLTMVGSYDQIASGFIALYSWIEECGHAAVGSPHATFLTDPVLVAEDEARWELWTEIYAVSYVPGTMDQSGCGIKIVPQRTLATTVHEGPVDSIETTHESLGIWVVERGFRIVGPPEEMYLTDAMDVSPEQIRTQVGIPVRCV